jgi:ABC-type Fe3+-hydroxamate transport system substrate-binding protein
MAPLPSDRLITRRLRLTATALVVLVVVGTLARALAADRPQRIISLVPSTTEMLFAMGAGDRVIAVGSYDHFPPAVEKLPRVGALLDPNTERILSMKPDLVVLYGTQNDLRTSLDRARISYYAYQHKGLPDITATIRDLGARVGSGPEANALADGIDRQLGDIRSRTSRLAHPKTLVVFGREPGSLKNIDASGGDGFLHDMLVTAGGIDALADFHRQSVTMSTELVLARAPEVIIEVHSPGGGFAAASDLSPWNALGSIPAVRNHRIYSLVGDEFVVPGPRVAAATERLAKTLHPEMP